MTRRLGFPNVATVTTTSDRWRNFGSERLAGAMHENAAGQRTEIEHRAFLASWNGAGKDADRISMHFLSE